MVKKEKKIQNLGPEMETMKKVQEAKLFSTVSQKL